jgi:hypothetical protein
VTEMCEQPLTGNWDELPVGTNGIRASYRLAAGFHGSSRLRAAGEQ